MFLLWLRQLPRCGDRIPASVPLPTEGRSSPTNTPVSLHCSFVLPSFTWFCIFFSTSQVLLCTLSWCYACTSVSEGVFLMYLWREMLSTSTYSSAILFSLQFFLKNCFGDNQGKNHHVLLLQLLQKLLTGTPVSTCTLSQIVQPATQSF